MRVVCDSLRDVLEVQAASSRYLLAWSRGMGHDEHSCGCAVCENYRESWESSNRLREHVRVRGDQ